VIDISHGAGEFTRLSLETFARCGLEVGEARLRDDFGLGPSDTLVLLGLVGAWRGAVAFRFDPAAVDHAASTMAEEVVEDEELIFDALLESVNVVAGRGAAFLAEEAGAAVWLTPPLLAKGENLQVRLQNFAGSCFEFSLGKGVGGILFSAAPANGGML
jgi:CheY-specific phosphatase CheX